MQITHTFMAVVSSFLTAHQHIIGHFSAMIYDSTNYIFETYY